MWCAESLRVRGTKDQIVRFLFKGLMPVNCFGDEKKSVIKRNDWELFINLEKQSRFHFYYPEEGEKAVLILSNDAWGLDVEELLKLSQEFGVDFRIGFDHDLEIVDGKIVKNKELRFEDYEWESLRPYIGTVHVLKAWPKYFVPVASGLKRFEIRKNDRNFISGDMLVLQEFDPETKFYTGRYCSCEVLYILAEQPFVPEGYVCMSINLISSPLKGV